VYAPRPPPPTTHLSTVYRGRRVASRRRPPTHGPSPRPTGRLSASGVSPQAHTDRLYGRPENGGRRREGGGGAPGAMPAQQPPRSRIPLTSPAAGASECRLRVAWLPVSRGVDACDPQALARRGTPNMGSHPPQTRSLLAHPAHPCPQSSVAASAVHGVPLDSAMADSLPRATFSVPPHGPPAHPLAQPAHFTVLGFALCGS
jgi:hypothetical protein